MRKAIRVLKAIPFLLQKDKFPYRVRIESLPKRFSNGQDFVDQLLSASRQIAVNTNKVEFSVEVDDTTYALVFKFSDANNADEFEDYVSRLT